MAISHQAIREVVEAFNRGELVLQLAVRGVGEDRYFDDVVSLHVRSRVVNSQPQVEIKAV
jgi:hypothetical protein